MVRIHGAHHKRSAGPYHQSVRTGKRNCRRAICGINRCSLRHAVISTFCITVCGYPISCRTHLSGLHYYLDFRSSPRTHLPQIACDHSEFLGPTALTHTAIHETYLLWQYVRYLCVGHGVRTHIRNGYHVAEGVSHARGILAVCRQKQQITGATRHLRQRKQRCRAGQASYTTYV